MFEDSLFASGVSADAKRSAGRRRWFALASVGLQGLVLSSFIIVPMIFPATLPRVALAPKVLLLPVHKPEVKVQPKPVHVETANSAAVHAPSTAPTIEHRGGAVVTPVTTASFPSEAPSLFTGGGMAEPSLANVIASSGRATGNGPNVVAAAPKSSAPFMVSMGVSKGLLLAPIQPIYPRIAIAAKIEGTVVVTATINKLGRIIGLQVLSGPEMLRRAAVDAVQDARYRPFLLSGEPTDVITTISVTFRLGA